MSEVLIHTALDPDGVLVASIDMRDRTMNVLSAGLMDALDALMDRVDGDPAVRSCVVTSGRNTFLAGADLSMVRGYCDAARTGTHDQLFAMCGRLGRQFVRLEASAKPWVAGVNGLALGGGLELALACRARLVVDDPRIQLGVPEVRWGLLPGAGGTQRLPRMAGFEPAMKMLLSGQSIDPAAAVKLGIFSSAEPGARLLDQARAVARALHGQPYNAQSKFHKLAQDDVPPYTEERARAIALQFGISAEDFVAYPAYSAIVDSVLKGARLPLAEATDVEMHQFLRLMFSPVAGRMVRTLFLERLRAERELISPREVGIERLALGPISARRVAWAQALGKLKLPQAQDPALPEDVLEVVDKQGARHRIGLQVLDETPSATEGPVAVLSPAGPYGRVMEIVGSAGVGVAELATKMRCLPWRTSGTASVLQSLRGLSLAEQETVAKAALSHVGDPAFLDVAACLAGVCPAWSGGPLSWRT